MTVHSVHRLARLVAHAAGSFEHRLLGRAPSSITVAAAAGSLTVCVHEPLAPVERGLARDAAGAARVQELHLELFDDALDALVVEVRRRTGVTLCGAIAHVDTATGSIVKTFTTGPCVDLFLFGPGLAALGVPVDVHVRAFEATRRRARRCGTVAEDGVRTRRNGSATTDGIGAVRVRLQPEGPVNHDEDEPCWC